MMTRCYSELITYSSFEDRFRYLSLDGIVGEETFGAHRWLNQVFYKSAEWKKVRNEIIIRDNACDLGVEGHEILQYRGIKLMIHHINPITMEDIYNHSFKLVDPENLITTIKRTHDAIHYGDESGIYHDPIERRPNDTCPWKR